MSEHVKCEFYELSPNGLNYLPWSLDAEILLRGKNLLKTILPEEKDIDPTNALFG
jgi:hypothetical protein